jgi:hypothetical protein
VSLFATERVPSTVAIDGVVVTDVVSRSLGVRLSETASGYQRMWWKTAHQALKAAVGDDWRRHPYVYASTPSAYRVAHVQPADFSILTVHFAVGVAGLAELISQPGLVAFVSIDRTPVGLWVSRSNTCRDRPSRV